MKNLNNFFKRYTWLLIMLGVLTCNAAPLLGANADMAPVVATLATIDGDANWENQIYELNNFLDDTTNPTLDPATQQKLFDLITKVYAIRLAQYKKSTTDLPITELNLMLANAANNSMLSSNQQTQVDGYQKTILVEQVIIQNQNEKSQDQQLKNINSALGSTGTTAFDPIIQGIFYQQLTGLFAKRTAAQATGEFQTRLNTTFTRAKTSTLIQDTNKDDVAAKNDVLGIESSLRKAAKDPVYASALSAVAPLQTQNQAKKFEDFTQTLNFTTISQFFNTRDNRSAAEITALINLITQATTTSLLNTTQQAQMKTMLASLAVEKSLIDAAAKTTFNDMLKALQDITAAGAGSKPSTSAQKLYSTTLQKLFGLRPSTDLQAVTALSALLTSAIASPLLADGDKASIQGNLTAVQVDITNATLTKQLQDILAIQDPAARLAALQKFMTDNAGKTLSADLQKTLQDGINTLINMPSTDPAFLKNLADFVGGLTKSSLVTPDFQKQMTTAQATINTNIATAALGKQLQDILAIADPAARMAALQKFMADNAGKPLPADIQKTLQDGINTLINTPSTDPAFLKNLSVFVGDLTNNPLLAPDFQKSISAAQTTVNNNLAAANQAQQLQDALKITDPAARLAALQAFMTANPNATLPAALQKTLQDGINTLINTPSTDPAFLTNLAKFTGDLNNSPLVTPDFKTQMIAAQAGITTNLNNATNNKALSDLTNITDPKLAADALSKFVTNNQGKTLTPEQQKALQASIGKLVNTATTLDPATIAALANTIQAVSSQPGLIGADGVATTQSMLPALKKAGDNATLLAGMQQALAQTDPNKKIDLMNQVMANSAGKDVTPATQAQLGQALQGLIANKPTDPTALGKLAGMLNQTQNSTAIDAATQQAIKSALPALTAATWVNTNALGVPGASTTNTAALTQQLQAILAITDPVARLAALQQFMTTNPLVSLPAALQQALQGGLQGLSTDPAILNNPAARASLINSIDSTNAALSALQTPGQVNGLPGGQVGGQAANTAALTQQLQAILAIQDPVARLAALQQFMTANPLVSLPAALQQALQGGLQGLSTDPAILNNPAARASLINSINSTNAALSALQTPGQVNGLPGGQAANASGKLTGLVDTVDEAKLLAGMQQALAQTDPNTKVALMNQVMANAAGKNISPTTQAQLGQALQGLIAIKPTDPAALNNLAIMMHQAQNSTTIDATSRQAIQSALPALAAQAGLNVNALSLANFGGQAGGQAAAGIAVSATTAAALQQVLQTALAIKNPAARLAALQKFMNDNAGVALPADVQAALSGGLQKLSQSKSIKKNPTALAALKNLTTTLSNMPQPTQQAVAGIASATTAAHLTGLVDTVDEAKLLAGMQQALGHADPNAKITMMHQVMAYATGKNLSPTAQAQLGHGLQSLIANKPTDKNALSNLAAMMHQAQNSTAIDAASRQAIQAALPGLIATTGLNPNALSLLAHGTAAASTAPAGVTGIAATIPGQTGIITDEMLIQEIQQAMQLPTRRAQMLALNTAMAHAGDRTFSAPLHQAYETAVQQLFPSKTGKVKPVAKAKVSKKSKKSKKLKTKKAK